MDYGRKSKRSVLDRGSDSPPGGPSTRRRTNQPAREGSLASTTSLGSSSAGTSSNAAHELRVENRLLRRQLEHERTMRMNEQRQLQSEAASRQAAEAHHALRTLEVEELRRQLKEAKQKLLNADSGGQARFSNAPKSEAALLQEQIDREKKKAEEAQRAINVAHKVYDHPMWWYSLKHDLKDLAASFALDQEGTIPELKARVRAHLRANPTLKADMRFRALFGGRKRQGAGAAKGKATEEEMEQEAVVSD